MVHSVRTTKKIGSRGWSSFALAIIILLLISLTLWWESPPATKGADAEGHEFSAERAFKHVEVIAQHPHPVGSAENEKVRQYLLQQMEELGLNPKVDIYPWTIKRNDITESFDLHNIIGVLKGSQGGKVLMLTAHYDSTPFGPGANDDAVGVAALLETARALQAGPQLANDVWFVLTDGEEPGLLGATAFWNEGNYRETIGLVANFEARGSKGPAIMFQTSNDNGTLISEFASFAPAPVSNSLVGEIYKTMPNDTDLTVSLKAGIPGLNFAHADGWDKYHSPLDTPEYVSLATLQHHGDNALAAAKHFGNVDLSDVASANRVYFNWFGILIHYPQSMVLPLTLLLCAMWVFSLIFYIRKETVSLKGVASGLLAIVAGILLSLAAAYIYYKVIDVLGILKPEQGSPAPAVNPTFYNIGIVLLALFVYLIVTRFFKRRVNEMEMVLSGMLFFILLLVGTTWFLPGASYLFALPLCVHAIVVGCAMRRKHPAGMLNRAWAIILCAILPITLFTSLFHLLFTAMPLSSNIVCAALCSILFALLHPMMLRFISVRPPEHRADYSIISG